MFVAANLRSFSVYRCAAFFLFVLGAWGRCPTRGDPLRPNRRSHRQLDRAQRNANDKNSKSTTCNTIPSIWQQQQGGPRADTSA